MSGAGGRDSDLDGVGIASASRTAANDDFRRHRPTRVSCPGFRVADFEVRSLLRRADQLLDLVANSLFVHTRPGNGPATERSADQGLNEMNSTRRLPRPPSLLHRRLWVSTWRSSTHRIPSN